MFQTTRTPVTVYRSTDPEAPQLTNAIGSLKTLLKACLHTGYGTGGNRKESLGWAMPFEEPFKAAFHSNDETSLQHFMQIDNSARGSYANVRFFAELEALNTLTSDFGVGSKEFSTSAHFQNFGYAYSNELMKWWLIGYSKAFILIIDRPNGNGATCLFFGDMPSLIPHDNGSVVHFYNTLNYATQFNSNTPVWFNSSNTESLPLCGSNYLKEVKRTWLGFSSLCQNGAGAPYPDKITGGLQASEIYLYDLTNGMHSNALLRFMFPGLFFCRHNISNMPQGQRIDMYGDVWLKFNLGNGAGSNCYLLNSSAWEV